MFLIKLYVVNPSMSKFSLKGSSSEKTNIFSAILSAYIKSNVAISIKMLNRYYTLAGKSNLRSGIKTMSCKAFKQLQNTFKDDDLHDSKLKKYNTELFKEQH